jgi:hypothetical protein
MTLLSSRIDARPRPELNEAPLTHSCVGNVTLARAFFWRMLFRADALKTVAEYREHAEQCRKLAESVISEEHKAALKSMAETWESLAREREARLAREKK